MRDYSLLFFCIAFWVNACDAWLIAPKNNAGGMTIHTTYFTSANNQYIDVRANVNLGTYINGQCVYTYNYDMGNEKIRTGDIVYFDAVKLKELVGGNYGCMQIFYTHQAMVMDNFQLIYDGMDYNTSYPFQTEVNLS